MSRITKPPIAVLFAIAVCALMGPLCQRAQADTTDTAAARSYIEGIEALNRADYAGAIQALSQAIKADGDNASYHRARGVAYTLSESFDNAITDLDRAQRIDPNDMEARLWEAAALRMSGDPAKGASLFTMRDLPHDYANMVYNIMAMQYWQSRYQGHYFDPVAKQQVQTNEPMKALFPDAAKAYAQRNRATGAAATEVITEQMKDAVKQGDWGLALQDLVQLRTNAPDDPTLCGYWAQAFVGAGDALKAREEFTRVLCITPLWADGYLGRAQAHMMLGDGPRAQADLEIAASLGAGRVEDLQQRLSKFNGAPAPADAVVQFEQAVQADAKFPELVYDAIAVHRLTNAQRMRYDESYQLRIRVLSEAMRDQPKNPDQPETLARFLFHFYNVPIVWNGPRGNGQQLRPQSQFDRDNEIRRAIELCDAALKIDEKSANAMATKGWLLYTIKAVGPEDLADNGLAIDGDNVRLLQLKITILLNHAGELEAQAGGLRAGHNDTHRETRSDGEYLVTTHYAPTAAELAQAAECAAKAAKLHEQANALQAHLKKVTDEVIPSLLKKGTSDLADGDLGAAHKSLMAVYAHNPDLQELLVQLADLSKRQGNAQQSQIYSLLTQPLQETTAADALKTTWDACTHTQWKAAAEAIDHAAGIDPTDARAAAYRAVILADGDNPDPAAARRSRIAALALEEARARLMGTTLLAENIPTPDLIGIQESGLALAVRLQAGDVELAAGQDNEAIADYAVNVAMEKRFEAQLRVQLVPTAMLPDPKADMNTVPTAPTLASLLGWSHLGLAKAYLATQHSAEAQAQYAAVRAYLASWPATNPDRETMNIVDSWARLGQAEAAVAAHDNSGALRILESDGWPGGLPEALDKRRKQLADQLHGDQNTQAWQQVQQQMHQSPTQMQAQALQQEITGLQKQRDSMAANMTDPNMSPNLRQAMQAGVDQLDALISQRKAALDKLQQNNP